MKLFQVMKMLYILIVMVVTQLYTSIKTQMIHFKLVNFNVCKITTRNYVLSYTEEVELSVHTSDLKNHRKLEWAYPGRA